MSARPGYDFGGRHPLDWLPKAGERKPVPGGYIVCEQWTVEHCRGPEIRGEVLRARFFEQLTLEEIGERMGLTRSRVGQIEADALRALRKNADLKNLAA